MNFAPDGANAQFAPIVANGHYVVLKAGANKLLGVANDDRATFLKFAGPVPESMVFFDGDGQPLKNIRHNDVACVLGHHRALLVIDGDKISFLAVREGAKHSGAPRVPDTATVRHLQETTNGRMAARKAMKKAMAGLKSGNSQSTDPAVNRAKAAMSAAIAAANANQTPVVTVQPDPSTIDWTATTAVGLPASALRAGGENGYLTFVDKTMQPVQAVPVIDGIGALAKANPGVVLVSGITPTQASDAQIALAEQRAHFVKKILVKEGIDAEQVTVTAVFRTDAPTRLNPSRPGESVSLKWLEARDPVLSTQTKKLSSR
jgi:outer membrane protein OmpA-like peptidoglycan-associated protein